MKGDKESLGKLMGFVFGKLQHVGKREKHNCYIFLIFARVFKKALFPLVLNFLANDKILDWSKLKALADDKVQLTEKLKFVFGRVENIVGKGF